MWQDWIDWSWDTAFGAELDKVKWDTYNNTGEARGRDMPALSLLHMIGQSGWVVESQSIQ